ncbi:hypothetical protein D0Z70_09855 [Sphingobium terrigena]|jgi:hypothetical protein|uniref:Uncharacterized protein n=1 Tax=Sphingobium terrigena TaxID=2304063 RepID=A0A418YT97_9SPHN|nr:MAG: hypothetical protein A2095_09055 [Sphingomonadales bacterium GWF1_63_6]RJG55115.1 hypothetical protein D0Z70_09855 [Sphingobium terrigena]
MNDRPIASNIACIMLEGILVWITDLCGWNVSTADIYRQYLRAIGSRCQFHDSAAFDLEVPIAPSHPYTKLYPHGVAGVHNMIQCLVERQADQFGRILPFP